MTCIAAVTDGKTVWMGGDSAGSNGYDVTVRRDPKVFRRGEFLMGFTDSFRMGQLLMCKLSPPTPREGQNLYEFMVTDFIDAVRQCFKDGGFARKDSEREKGGTFLVGYRGRLFEVESDYQVGETDDPYDAVGCGEAFAKGVFYALRSMGSMTPSDKIVAALEAAAHHSEGVRGPFTILSTPD